MKKRVPAILMFLALFAATQICQAQDSLKVHVLGYFFKNESFKFYTQKHIIHKKVNKGFDACIFYIPIDSTIKHGDQLDLYVLRKSNMGTKYKNTKLVVHYESDRKYLLINRGFREKDKYCLTYTWFKDLPISVRVKPEFWWDNHTPSWATYDTIEKRKPIKYIIKE